MRTQVTGRNDKKWRQPPDAYKSPVRSKGRRPQTSHWRGHVPAFCFLDCSVSGAHWAACCPWPGTGRVAFAGGILRGGFSLRSGSGPFFPANASDMPTFGKLSSPAVSQPAPTTPNAITATTPDTYLRLVNMVDRPLIPVHFKRLGMVSDIFMTSFKRVVEQPHDARNDRNIG